MNSMFKTKTFWVNVIGTGIDLLAMSELTSVIPPSAAPYISVALAVFNIILRRLRSEDSAVTFSGTGSGDALRALALFAVPSIFRMMSYAILVASLAIGISACSLKGKARHTAVVADTGVYTALATLQDGEMVLYKTCTAPTVAPSLVRPCADVVRNHAEFSRRLVPALETGQRLNRVIRNWPQDKPAPEELPQLVNELKLLTDALVANMPDSELKSKLLTYSFAASNAALQLLVMFAR